MSQENQDIIYRRSEVVIFRKTKEAFGGLSNMAAGFPIEINGIHIRTSEALYQACRFPHSEEIQRIIIEEKSPMAAKMKSKKFRVQTRNDRMEVRVDIMRWCLKVKLACNWDKFKQLLMATENKPIVEESRRDKFWGAIPNGDEILIGQNILGRLLMELREELKNNDISTLEIVEPPPIENFVLLNKKIPTIYAKKCENKIINIPEQLEIFT